MIIDLDPDTGKLIFEVEDRGALVGSLRNQYSEHFKTSKVEAAGAAATATTD